MTVLTSLHPIALLVAERLVAGLVVGCVLTACAALSLRLMGRQNARTKFALCFATLAGIAAVPLMGWWQARAAAGAQAGPVPVVRLPEEWAMYIFAIWALGASLALGRVALGLYRVWQLRRSCVPVDPTNINSEEKLQHAMEHFQSKRRVELCTSELVRVPTAIGFWRPAVALPAWCLRDLSSGELHAVVLHELEHLRRFDDWTNLFQQIVNAIFFFHPAVWWLGNRLSLEREVACDDAVLAIVPDPKSYARCLVSLAEKTYLRRGLALAQAAVSRMQQLTARVTKILDAGRPRATAIWKPAFSIVVVAAVAGGAAMEVSPRLVAFQNTAAPNNAASHSLAAKNSAKDNDALSPLAPTQVAAAADVGGSVEHPALVPKAVPARWTVQNIVQTPAAAHKPARNSVPNHVPSPTNLAENSSPRVTAASRVAASELNVSTRTADAPMRAQVLVMVVHTEQRDEAGAVIWSIQVVRWMVFHPQPQTRVSDPQRPAKT